jgi:hypothetical protein
MNTVITQPATGRARFGVLLALGLVGCGNVAETGSRGPDITNTSNSTLSTTTNTSDGAGFKHMANNSRFSLGANPSPKLEFGLSKLVGSDGVFATVPETGWVLAIPNAHAPSRLADPLTRSPEVHNKAVVDYFVGAGLPANQVGTVNAHASVQGSGSGPLAGPLPNGEFAGYTSVITRVVAGVPVPDSFAWARFNINGVVVEEQVYWPTVPNNVVQEAKALVAMLADPTRNAAFARKLPANLVLGQVVIRHSAGSYRAAFESVASYDVTQPGQMGRVRHFDRNAAEFAMVSEAEPAPPAATRVRGHQ